LQAVTFDLKNRSYRPDSQYNAEVKDKMDQPEFPQRRWMTALKVLMGTVVVSVVTSAYFAQRNCNLGIVGFSASSCNGLSSEESNAFIGFGLLGLGGAVILFLVFLVLVLIACIKTVVWFLKRDR
jgi:hypothetical protein